MDKTTQETPSVFSQYIGKIIKVVYKEFDTVQIGRGLLDSVGKDFLTLDGDYSVQTIPLHSIIKISFIKDKAKQDGSATK